MGPPPKGWCKLCGHPLCRSGSDYDIKDPQSALMTKPMVYFARSLRRVSVMSKGLLGPTSGRPDCMRPIYAASF